MGFPFFATENARFWRSRGAAACCSETWARRPPGRLGVLANDPFTVVVESVDDRYRHHLLRKASLRRRLDHALLRFQRGVSLEFDVDGEFLRMRRIRLLPTAFGNPLKTGLRIQTCDLDAALTGEGAHLRHEAGDNS